MFQKVKMHLFTAKPPTAAALIKKLKILEKNIVFRPFRPLSTFKVHKIFVSRQPQPAAG
jgi:hypothetical protein